MPPIIELSRKNFDIVPVQCAIGDVDRSLDEFRVIDLRTNPTWLESHGYLLNFDEESDEIFAGLCGYEEDF